MPKQMPRGLRPILAIGQFVVRILPPRTASGLMAYLLARSGETFVNRSTIQRNLRGAFPDLDKHSVDALATRISANFGRLISEIIHIDRFRDGARGARLEAGPRQWQGSAILVGAHLGAWELLPVALADDASKLTAIYSRNKNPVIDEIMSKMRASTGANYVEKSVALKPCIEALKHGGLVVMLADQRVDSGLEVDFFGRRTVVTRFPARLAMKFSRPIVPFEITRTGPGHLKVHFLDPIMPGTCAGADAELELTQKMATAIERSITRNADSWFCNKHRWKAKTV